jgi:hypothetical protein
LKTLVIKTLQNFSKSSLIRYSQEEEGPGEYRRRKEPNYQCELYKAMSKLLGGKAYISSEWTLLKRGRADFFIPKKKWAIELLADFDRLDDHLLRFEPNGTYHSWIQKKGIVQHITINIT